MALLIKCVFLKKEGGGKTEYANSMWGTVKLTRWTARMCTRTSINKYFAIETKLEV